jgi:hypothetical protein
MQEAERAEAGVVRRAREDVRDTFAIAHHLEGADSPAIASAPEGEATVFLSAIGDIRGDDCRQDDQRCQATNPSQDPLHGLQ